MFASPVLAVLGFWFLGIHWEKEWMLALASALVVGASGAMLLKEKATGKASMPVSLYLLLVALWVATVSLGFKVAEIYDRLWYVYK